MIANNFNSIYSDTHLNWLKSAGITPPIAQIAGWKPVNVGFLVPTGDGFRHRLINFDPRYSYKTAWDKKTEDLPMPPLYGSHLPDFTSHMVFVVNGEKSVLAMRSAGFKNVISTFGELSRILEAAEALKGDSDYLAINHIPDLDETGDKASEKWIDACQQIGAYYQRYDLSLVLKSRFKMSSDEIQKKDIRDLWLLSRQDIETFQDLFWSMPMFERVDPPKEPITIEHASKTKIESARRPAAADVPHSLNQTLDFDRVRREIPLQDVIATKFQIKQVGAHFTTKEHDSLIVNPRYNKYHWNSRDEHGSTIDFVMRHIEPNFDEIEAAKWLYHFAGWILPEPEKRLPPTPITAERGTKSAESAKSKVKVVKINKPYLEASDIPDSGVIAIESGIGTNKTGAIGEAIKNDDRSFWVNHRVSLTESTGERLSDLGAVFEHYQGLQHEMPRLSKVISTLNSAHYLMNDQGDLPQFDSIIIDEDEQVLESLFGGTYRKNEGIQAYEVMVNIIKRARRVILADANMTQLTLKWISQYRDDIIHLKNEYIRERGTLYMMPSYDQLMEVMVKTIRDSQKPVAIACDQRRKAEEAYNFLTSFGFNVRVIHSGNSANKDTQAFVKNINQEIGKLDALIYSPSLGTGVDIQADVDSVFGVFLNATITPHDQDQMLGRCRKASHFYVFSQDVQRVLDVSPKKIWESYLKNIATYSKRHGVTIHHDDNGKLKLPEVTRDFLALYCQIKAKNNRMMLNPRKSFIAHMRKNFKIVDIEDNFIDLYHNKLKGIAKELREWRNTLILTCEPVERAEYDLAREQGRMTPEIEFGNKRHQIQDFYGLEIDEKLLGDWNKDGRNKLHFFINAHQGLDQLRERDIAQMEDGYPAHKWRLIADKVPILTACLRQVYGAKIHFDEISESEMLERLETFNLLYDRLRVDRLFHRQRHHSKDPLARLRWVLGQFGLTLLSIRRGQDKAYFYAVDEDRYQHMVELAGARCKHHEIEVDLSCLPTSDRFQNLVKHQNVGGNNQKKQESSKSAQNGHGKGGEAA